GRVSPEAAPIIIDHARNQDVVAVGPGLGRGDAVSDVVSKLMECVNVPLVLDADGLNALTGRLESLRNRKCPTILTPHPGEFARLLEKDVAMVQAQRAELATRFARDYEVIVVLKGHGTVVTDGRRMYLNTTGNPGMATGGTGDVLTGMIAALVGQGL